MREFRRLMEINSTEREGYIGVREEILLKNSFNFVLFQYEKVVQEEQFLVFGVFFSLCICHIINTEKDNLYS